MPTFVIERTVPGAGVLCAEELRAIAGKANQVLADMDGRVVWQHSYVTDGKFYCVFLAEDETAVLEHAKRGGFPADVVSRVRSVIDPVTGE